MLGYVRSTGSRVERQLLSATPGSGSLSDVCVGLYRLIECLSDAGIHSARLFKTLAMWSQELKAWHALAS